MSEMQRSGPPGGVALGERGPNRLLLLVPLVLFALVCATVGVLAARVVNVTNAPQLLTAINSFGEFSDNIHVKVWLTTAAIILALTQLLTAARIYEKLQFPPPGRFYNFVHRWSGR